MQFPKGSVFNVETMRMEMDSFWTIISSEWAQATFTHTVSAGYMTGAVFVMAISAWYLLRKRDVEFAKKSLMIACAFGSREPSPLHDPSGRRIRLPRDP